MVSVTLDVRKSVDMPSLMSRPMRAFFEDAVLLSVETLSEPGVVPIDTGRLRDSLAAGAGVTRIDQADPPMRARVGTNVVYAGTLEEGEHPANGATLHYRGGPSKGRPTRGWFSTAVQDIQPDIDGLLMQLADDLAAEWAKVTR